ncbi:uncharacterized protein N7469_008324 [Penicillium citrinum]|uniref:WGR domain-containing protein n=1 Tax=Penicillium citrinum TaxID=5077 RepID=A0A9W9NRH9_PENCI|nr:uncharacterized protein N7469_008324 [Penicillium citrinum]KAJ5224821.1 hypothetical protein N7469_008324 [Penicillium citrinum]
MYEDVPVSLKGAKGVPRGRPYHEPDDGDIWEATLVRTCNPPHRREKYQLAVCFNELQKAYQWNTNGLQIIQSIAKRPTYATYAKYSRVGLSKVELLAPPLKNPSAAMKKFMEFFKEQTGVEWADRKTEKLPPPKCNDDGEPLPPHEGWYHMETHTNLFTDYLKSWQQPTGPSGADIHGQSGLMTDDSNLQSTDLAAISEELSQNHALLASLISKDLEISDGVKPTEEEKDEEDSVREDLIRSLTCTEDGKSNK